MVCFCHHLEACMQERNQWHHFLWLPSTRNQRRFGHQMLHHWTPHQPRWTCSLHLPDLATGWNGIPCSCNRVSLLFWHIEWRHVCHPGLLGHDETAISDWTDQLSLTILGNIAGLTWTKFLKVGGSSTSNSVINLSYFPQSVILLCNHGHIYHLVLLRVLLLWFIAMANYFGPHPCLVELGCWQSEVVPPHPFWDLCWWRSIGFWQWLTKKFVLYTPNPQPPALVCLTAPIKTS